MIRFVSTLFTLLALAGIGGAAPTRSLEPQLSDLLTKVSDALEKDVALKGRTVSLGLIASEDRPDSNFAPELRRLFEIRLKGKLIADGFLKLSVHYDLAQSDESAEGDNSGKKMKVLVIRVLIKDENKKELFNKSVEINESADIARVLGLTVSPPPNGGQDKRNKEIDEAYHQNKGKQPEQVTPTFQIKNGTQIGIIGNSRFFVEILVKDSPNADLPDDRVRAAKPTANPFGNAFVDIKGNQFYEVRVHNNDDYACVAKILIDGQDAMNRFNVDGVHYNGLLIEKGQFGVLKGWMHTTKPRPKERDNVFAFQVREYAHGSGTPIKSSGEVGVITVQFAVAWKEGEARPAGRNIGRETDKGPGLEQSFKVEKRHIGEFNDTISIRYSPTAK